MEYDVQYMVFKHKHKHNDDDSVDDTSCSLFVCAGCICIFKFLSTMIQLDLTRLDSVHSIQLHWAFFCYSRFNRIQHQLMRTTTFSSFLSIIHPACLTNNWMIMNDFCAHSLNVVHQLSCSALTYILQNWMTKLNGRGKRKSIFRAKWMLKFKSPIMCWFRASVVLCKVFNIGIRMIRSVFEQNNSIELPSQLTN